MSDPDVYSGPETRGFDEEQLSFVCAEDLLLLRGWEIFMEEFLFLLAVVLLGVSSTVGMKIENSYAINRPLNMGPLRLVSNMAALVGLLFLIWGFFAFSWWLPIVGILCHMIIGGVLVAHTLSRVSAPLRGLLFGVVGLGVALVTFLVMRGQ